MPAQNAILTEVNSTFVTLAMDTWLSGGCAVESFDVALQEMGTSVWHTVENSIPGNVVSILSTLFVVVTPGRGSVGQKTTSWFSKGLTYYNTFKMHAYVYFY